MDLCFNRDARFTRWVVANGFLAESFVMIDIGVQGGENPRWHLLGDRLVVHGFDARERGARTTRSARSNPARLILKTKSPASHRFFRSLLVRMPLSDMP
jgi:hypothetical protein